MPENVGQVQVDLGLNVTQAERQANQFLRSFAEKKAIISLDARAASQSLGRISAQASQFSKSLDAANARVLAFTASAGSIFLVERAFVSLIKSTVEVEKSLANINVVLNQSGKSLQDFGNSLFNTANQTGASFKAAGEAALEFSRQGLGVQATLQRTRDALILTRISGLQVKDSMEALTAGVNSFSKTAITTTEIVNKLAKVDANFAVSAGDLAEALQRVGSTAESAGVSFDELIAFVTTAQQITQRGGAVIGNALKSIFTRIQRPEVLSQFKELGIEITNAENQLLSVPQVLQGLADAFKNNLTPAQENFVSELTAGLFQINQFKAIVGDLTSQFSNYTRALQDSRSATNEAISRNEELNKTFSSLIQRTSNNLLNFQSQIGKISLGPVIDNLLKALNTGLEGLNNSDSQSFGQKIGAGILTGIGKFLSGPGAIAAGAGILALIKNLAKFTFEAAKDFVAINTGIQQQVQLQGVLTSLLEKEPILLDRIRSGTLSVAEAQNILLNSLRQETAVREKIAAITLAASKNLLGSGAVVLEKTAQGRIVSARPAANEKVPNFALSPVQAAIEREVNAGIPRSMIRVGASERLVGPQNPDGLGIYNIKDEPGGLEQGIQRAAKLGLNPKTHGLESPNFAISGQGISQRFILDNLKSGAEKGLYFSDFYDKYERTNPLINGERNLFNKIYASQSFGADDRLVFNTSIDIFKQALAGVTEFEETLRKIGLTSLRGAILEKVLAGADLTSAKTSVYYRALSGDKNAIAVDRNVIQTAVGRTLPEGKLKLSTGFRERLTDSVHQVAQSLAIDPRAAQAAIFAGRSKFKPSFKPFEEGFARLTPSFAGLDIAALERELAFRNILGKTLSLRDYNKIQIKMAERLGGKDLLFNEEFRKAYRDRVKVGEVSEVPIPAFAGQFDRIDTRLSTVRMLPHELPDELKQQLKNLQGKTLRIATVRDHARQAMVDEVRKHGQGILESFSTQFPIDTNNIVYVEADPSKKNILGFRYIVPGRPNSLVNREANLAVFFDSPDKIGSARLGTFFSTAKSSRSSSSLGQYQTPNFADFSYTAPKISSSYPSLDYYLAKLIETAPGAPALKQFNFGQSPEYTFTSKIGKGVRGDFSIAQNPNIRLSRRVYGNLDLIQQSYRDPKQKEKLQKDLVRTLGHETAHRVDKQLKLNESPELRIATQQDKQFLGGKFFNEFAGVSIKADPYKESLAELLGRYFANSPLTEYIEKPMFGPGGPIQLVRQPIPFEQFQTFNYLRDRGVIPSFASDYLYAVSDAINRESQTIKVGHSSQLQSPTNPLGFGVYNRIDEPQGLSQGIARARSEGISPRTYGLPNFANLEVREGFIGGDIARQLHLDTASKQFDLLANKLKSLEISFTDAIAAARKIHTSFELTDRSLKSMVSTLGRIKSNDLLLKTAVETVSQNIAKKVTTETPIIPPIILPFKNQLTGPVPRQQPFISQPLFENKPEPKLLNAPPPVTYPSHPSPVFGPTFGNRILYGSQATISTGAPFPTGPVGGLDKLNTIITLAKKRIETELSVTEAIVQQAKYKKLAEVGGTFRQNVANTGTLSNYKYPPTSNNFVPPGATRPPGELLQDLDEGLYNALYRGALQGPDIDKDSIRRRLEAKREKIRKAQQEAEEALAEREFAASESIFSLFPGTSSYKKAQSFKNRNPAQFAQNQAKAQSRFQNAALGVSIAAPIAFETAAQFIPQNSTTGRGSAAIVSGLGNVLSFGATGAFLTGGTPIGAAVGAGIGALASLPDIFDKFTNQLPELTEKFEELRQKTNENRDAITRFIDVSGKIADIESGATPGTVGTRQRLLGIQSEALSRLSPDRVAQLRAVINERGGISRARDLLSQFTLLDEQQLTIADLRQKIEKIRTENKTFGFETLTEEDRTKPSISKIPVVADEFGRRIEGEATVEVFPRKLKDSIKLAVDSLGNSLFNLTGIKDGKAQSIFQFLGSEQGKGTLTQLNQPTIKPEEFLNLIKQTGSNIGIPPEEINSAVEFFGKFEGSLGLIIETLQKQINPKVIEERNKLNDDTIINIKKSIGQIQNFSTTIQDTVLGLTLFNERLKAAGELNLQRFNGFQQRQNLLSEAFINTQQNFLQPEALAALQRQANIGTLRTQNFGEVLGATTEFQNSIASVNVQALSDFLSKEIARATEGKGTAVDIPTLAERALTFVGDFDKNAQNIVNLFQGGNIKAGQDALKNQIDTLTNLRNTILEARDANSANRIRSPDENIKLDFVNTQIESLNKALIDFQGSVEKSGQKLEDGTRLEDERLVILRNQIELQKKVSFGGGIQNLFRDQYGGVLEVLRSREALRSPNSFARAQGAFQLANTLSSFGFSREDLDPELTRTIKSGLETQIKLLVGATGKSLSSQAITDIVNQQFNTQFKSRNTRFAEEDLTKLFPNLKFGTGIETLAGLAQNAGLNVRVVNIKDFGTGTLTPVGIQDRTYREGITPLVNMLVDKFESDIELIDNNYNRVETNEDDELFYRALPLNEIIGESPRISQAPIRSIGGPTINNEFADVFKELREKFASRIPLPSGENTQTVKDSLAQLVREESSIFASRGIQPAGIDYGEESFIFASRGIEPAGIEESSTVLTSLAQSARETQALKVENVGLQNPLINKSIDKLASKIIDIQTDYLNPANLINLPPVNTTPIPVTPEPFGLENPLKLGKLSRISTNVIDESFYRIEPTLTVPVLPSEDRRFKFQNQQLIDTEIPQRNFKSSIKPDVEPVDRTRTELNPISIQELNISKQSGFARLKLPELYDQTFVTPLEKAEDTINIFSKSIDNYIELIRQLNIEFQESGQSGEAFRNTIIGINDEKARLGTLAPRDIVREIETTSLVNQRDIFNDLRQSTQDLTNSIRVAYRELNKFNNIGLVADSLTKQANLLASASRESFITGNISGAQYRKNVSLANNIKEDVGTLSLQDIGSEFATSFSYNTKDLFGDLREGAQEFSESLKSGFKDAFKSFALEGKSALDSLRGFGLNIASKLLDKSLDVSTGYIFQGLGAAAKGIGSYFNYGKNRGGLIQEYSSGGLVTGGSGVKDDVPAYLSAGEFVLNRKAVENIGPVTLEQINAGTRYLKSRVDIGPNSADIVLANYFGYDDAKKPTRGYFVQDRRLSQLALEDENNPQNAIRRQRIDAFIDYRNRTVQALEQFKKQQQQTLTAAYISTAINLAGGAANAYFKAPSGGFGGAGATGSVQGTAGSFSNPSSIGLGYSLNSNNYQSSLFDTTLRLNARNMGGLIRRYDTGGSVFGGDSSTDNVPALLTGGEFVVRKPMVDKIGRNTLEKWNRGEVSGFANGGFVGDTYAPATENSNEVLGLLKAINDSLKSKNTPKETPAQANGINNSISITINIDKNGKADTQTQTNSNNKDEASKTQNENLAKQLSEGVSAKVYEILNKEIRPGGLLKENLKPVKE